MTAPLLDALIAERAELTELMAYDWRERTEENYRRRRALDHRIARWRRDGVPRTKRYGYLKQPSSNSRNGSDSEGGDTADQSVTATCAACGRQIPEYHSGRKTRADARYCPGGACKQRAYRERIG